MNPNPTFVWDDPEAMRAFVAARAFAAISIVIDERPATAWAPIAAMADGSFRFHLARRNDLVAHLDGAPVLAGILGDNFYVSPDWYESADQVPTWNYELVEIEGIARRLDEAELVEQLDQVSAAQESRLAPKPAWTSGKMTPARFDAMCKAIVGFAIEAPELRGMRKFNQNKNAADRDGVITALRALGNDRAVAAMSPLPLGGEGK
jgi:transcriptional regulator